MDPEAKKLLEESLDLARENNQMLKKVRGVQKRAAFFSFLKIIFWIAVALGAMYFIQPYIDQAQHFLESTGKAVDKFQSLLPQ